MLGSTAFLVLHTCFTISREQHCHNLKVFTLWPELPNCPLSLLFAPSFGLASSNSLTLHLPFLFFILAPHSTYLKMGRIRTIGGRFFCYPKRLPQIKLENGPKSTIMNGIENRLPLSFAPFFKLIFPPQINKYKIFGTLLSTAFL